MQWLDMTKGILAHQGKAIALPAPLHCTMRSHLLPQSSRYIHLTRGYDSENPNSAIEYYLQIGDPNDIELRCHLFLLSVMIQEPAFNQLRTKEQLGYIVWASMRKIVGVMGLKVIIQSERDTCHLEQRIESFLGQYDAELDQMSSERFQHFVQASITALSKKDDNLTRESARWWRHIQSGYYEFNQIETDVAMLQTIKKAEFQRFYRTFIVGDRVTKLSVHIRASGTSDAAYTGIDHVVSDLGEFKKRLVLSPTAVPRAKI